MLQQTQVATVIRYYCRFMDECPTAAARSAAPLERVLELWSGLGYYRRARMMHQAAREIAGRFAGRFPATYDEARSLPGIGDYTARAVLSIAHNQPYAVLEGNVARVIARLTARRGNIHQKSFRRAVEGHLERLISRRRPGEFNQALMQLGQTVCLPRAPRCEPCPLRTGCQAYQLGRPEDFPSPRPRRATELHHLATAVLRQGGKVALVRGLDENLLGDLWNFPAAFGRSRQAARDVLIHKIGQILPRTILGGRSRAAISHNITHRVIAVEIYQGELVGNEEKSNAKVPRPRSAQRLKGFAKPAIRWISFRQMRTAAVSRLAQKIAEALV